MPISLAKPGTEYTVPAAPRPEMISPRTFSNTFSRKLMISLPVVICFHPRRKVLKQDHSRK
jgi:hypothetical protein